MSNKPSPVFIYTKNFN